MNTICSGVTVCGQQGALGQGSPLARHGAAAPACVAGLPAPLPARRRRSSGLGALQAAWAAPARAHAQRRARLGVSAVASPVGDIEGLRLQGLTGDELKEADLKNLRSVRGCLWQPDVGRGCALVCARCVGAAAARHAAMPASGAAREFGTSLGLSLQSTRPRRCLTLTRGSATAARAGTGATCRWVLPSRPRRQCAAHAHRHPPCPAQSQHSTNTAPLRPSLWEPTLPLRSRCPPAAPSTGWPSRWHS